MYEERIHGFYAFHGTTGSCALEITKSQEFEIQGLLVIDNKQDPEKIRCFVLSLLPDSIWMIQRTFNVDKSKFDKSELLVAMELPLVGTQVCVRHHNVIMSHAKLFDS